MSPEGNFEKAIPPDCVTAGKQQLEADSGGRVIWLTEENHAYFIPAGAKPTDQIQGLINEVTIAGKKFKVLPREVGELEKILSNNKASDITNFLLPDKRRRRE